MDRDTAEQILHLSDELDRLWRYLGHVDAAKGYRQKAEAIDKHTEELRKELQNWIIQTHEQSKNYINVVVAIGYAAYFAIWNFSNSTLLPDERALVALLGIISITLFCLWEFFIVQYRMNSLGKMGQMFRDMLSPEDFERSRQEIVAAEAQWIQTLTPVWRLVVTVSISTIFLGAAVMLRRSYLSL